VLTRAEEYLAKAEECERGGAAARDHLVKAQFDELACQWRELAAVAAQTKR
jgi:hypothetical protein